MKIKVQRDIFASALSKCVMVVSPKSIIPALDNLLITAKDREMVLRGSSGSIDVICTIPIESDDEMSVCIPARILSHTVNMLRDDHVTITQKNGKVEIKSISGKYNFSGIDPKEYLTLAEVKADNTITVSGALLKKGARIAGSYVNPKDVRPSLTGVNIYCNKDRIIMQGSDGNSLSRAIFPIITGTEWGSVIVPKQFIQVVSSALHDSDVTLVVSQNRIKATSEGVEVSSTLVEGNFPDCDKIVFSKRPSKKCTALRAIMEESLRRLKPFLDEVTPILRMEVKENSMVLMNEGGDHSGAEVIDIEGDEIGIGEAGILLGPLQQAMGGEDTMYINLYADPSCNQLHIEASGEIIQEQYAISKTMLMVTV